MRGALQKCAAAPIGRGRRCDAARGPSPRLGQLRPLYEACHETGLPLVIHFSGLEGLYRGAQPLSGGVHSSAFARLC